jgi:hypothetical protein
MDDFGQLDGLRWVRLADGRVMAAGGDVLLLRHDAANAQHFGSSPGGAACGGISPAQNDICVAPKK